LKSIHLIAPSGASLDTRSPIAGIEWLQKQGIEVLNVACVDRVDQRFAGSDAERLAEINQLATLSPDSVAVAMRGGYGLHRLLPDIEWSSISKAI